MISKGRLRNQRGFAELTRLAFQAHTGHARRNTRPNVRRNRPPGFRTSTSHLTCCWNARFVDYLLSELYPSGRQLIQCSRCGTVHRSSMPPFFPTIGALQDVFSSQTTYAQYASNPPLEQHLPNAPKQRRFAAWSTIDDGDTKAGALSAEARKEISQANVGARGKTGQIELYSPKYYAACTFGGLMACVGT